MPRLAPTLAIVALAPLMLGSECGPSPQQAGTAVILAAPVAVLVGLVLVYTLHLMWRRARPTHRLALVPHLVVAGACLALGALLLLAGSGGRKASEWVSIALVTFGPAYLTIYLLAWRVWLVFRPATATLGALAIATLVMIAPASLALAGLEGEWYFMLWIIPGYYGAPPFLLLLGLLIEAAIRSGRPPPAPPAPPPAAATP